MLRKWSKHLAGQRSSGVTEMENTLPLSATKAPYFFNPRSTAFSSLVQFSGMTKPAFNRKRCPIAGRLGLVLAGGAA